MPRTPVRVPGRGVREHDHIPMGVGACGGILLLSAVATIAAAGGRGRRRGWACRQRHGGTGSRAGQGERRGAATGTQGAGADEQHSREAQRAKPPAMACRVLGALCFSITRDLPSPAFMIVTRDCQAEGFRREMSSFDAELVASCWERKLPSGGACHVPQKTADFGNKESVS